MKSFLRRLILADVEQSADEKRASAVIDRELDQERGDYRQAITRVEVGTRLMLAWENANKMVRGQE